MIETQQWSLEQLQRLIDDRIQESDQLEFKAAATLRDRSNRADTVSKFVSGMANAAGGVIIFGMAESVDKHFAGKIEGLTSVECSKETLDQLIDKIQPKIIGIKIDPVLVLNEPEPQFAFVVTVPQSVTAHQALDFKYYRRRNFETKPIADYEIRELMNRKTHPDLQVSFRFYKSYKMFSRLSSDDQKMPSSREINSAMLEVQVTNVGAILAQYVSLDLVVPSITFDVSISHSLDYTGTADSRIIFYLKNIGNKTGIYVPLLPKRTFTWGAIRIDSGDIRAGMFGEWERGEIIWDLYADSAPAKTGKINIKDIEEIVRPS